ncbi:tetratricopeptide repeat protein [Echinicola salinicaeni]|uniref:tetratricopeptide repeat protein n=1 Tax=Echinicola salinicaeni TaxID=2762757 RepID=UPI00164812F1|nr:hypothetical protein [Echinicola salinicaeni]
MKGISGIILLALLAIACQSKEVKQAEVSSSAPVICAPITNDKDWYNGDNIAPLFEGLGDFHYPIDTDDELVQRYFDQGFILAYGFNHAEAARSFYYASKLDPNCAMAQWGFAYVLGPNYNAGMESDNYERAYEAIQKAIFLVEKSGNQKERALIEAMAKRYVAEPPQDRYPLDVAYSEAMGELYEKYPRDANIGALYAESLMNLHKWDLFDKSGEAKPWTPPILKTLEEVIKIDPVHPGAHHFYIHVVESSSHPERGYKSAQLFDEGLVPNAGHLVHMPAHIYIRTGDYHKGSVANIKSIEVDSAYVSACNAQGAYPLAYFPHNQHFLAGTATLEGNSKWAIYAADEVAHNANLQLMKEPGWGTIQHYYSIPFYVYVKFGKWDEILEMENKVPELDYPRAVHHYARGMAFLGKGHIDQAKEELASLSKIAEDESLKQITIWDINTVYELLQIAQRVLKAEILAKENNFEGSIALLEEAVKIEDSLSYNEPPDWFFSVRHHLGAMQLEAGRYQDAVNTYNEDLFLLPKNGWALKGLSLAYANLGDKINLSRTEKAFDQAWSTADIELKSSVIK